MMAQKTELDEGGSAPPSPAGMEEVKHGTKQETTTGETHGKGKLEGRKAPPNSATEDNDDDSNASNSVDKYTFPEKLRYLLDNATVPDTFWWNEDGLSFGMDISKKICDNVNQLFPGKIKLESFIRKLNRWGFRRMSSGKNSLGNAAHYKCALFQRGKPELMKGMKYQPGGSRPRRKTSTNEADMTRTQQQVRLGMDIPSATQALPDRYLSHLGSMNSSLALSMAISEADVMRTGGLRDDGQSGLSPLLVQQMQLLRMRHHAQGRMATGETNTNQSLSEDDLRAARLLSNTSDISSAQRLGLQGNAFAPPLALSRSGLIGSHDLGNSQANLIRDRSRLGVSTGYPLPNRYPRDLPRQVDHNHFNMLLQQGQSSNFSGPLLAELMYREQEMIRQFLEQEQPERGANTRQRQDP